MNIINEPIITSMLDDDLYKFTQQQAFLKLFPKAKGRYVFNNRGGNIFGEINSRTGTISTDFIDSLKFQIEEVMPSLKILDEEIDWMAKTIPFLNPWYLEYLRNFRYNPKNIQVSLDEKGALHLEANGTIIENMMWEVKLMSTISELYFKIIDMDWDMNMQRQIAIKKAKRLSIHDCKFVDFGTRRRRSLNAQSTVIKEMMPYLVGNTLQDDSGIIIEGKFAGTSNVYLAKKYGLTPKGTQAHEWFQAMQALEGIRHSNYFALNNWVRVYRGNLGIALPDTIGAENFFDNFSLQYAKMFDGLRWDSGDPYWFTDLVVNFYNKMKINPLHKTIVYSNALDIYRAVKIRKYCENKINASFGIGTHFTNDFLTKDGTKKSKPLNMVIKLWSVNGIPVVKLSDDKGKVMGDPDAIRVTKWMVRTKNQYNE